MAIILNISDPTATEILDANGNETGVTVQDLINSLCDVMDGTENYDIVNMTGLPQDQADRLGQIRDLMRPLWTYPDGQKVIKS